MGRFGFMLDFHYNLLIVVNTVVNTYKWGLPYMVVFTMLLSTANCRFSKGCMINNPINDQEGKSGAAQSKLFTDLSNYMK